MIFQMILISYLAISIKLANAIVNIKTKTIVTKLGSVTGFLDREGDFYHYLGIPYATVNWSNVFGDAIPNPQFTVNSMEALNNESKICAQVEFDAPPFGTVDCLNLNVYVPETDTKLLAVMVYICGGMFQFCFANNRAIGPKFLVNHDVIVVTINFRVGVYGFLCLDTPEVPGNQGLKDIVKALKWIRDNIIEFGGDKHKVTLFGMSSGSMAVHHLLLSPEDKIFNNVIMHSGTAFNLARMSPSNPTALLSIARELNLNVTDKNEALKLLSNMPASEVLKAGKKVQPLYLPCVEKAFPDTEILITDYAMNINKVPHIKGMQVMIGQTTDESLLISNDVKTETVKSERQFKEHLEAKFDFPNKMIEELESIVIKFYAGDEAKSNLDDAYLEFISDFEFVYFNERTMKQLQKSEVGKIYTFTFAYQGERNFIRYLNKVVKEGVAHSDELSYLFEVKRIPMPISDEDAIMIDIMTTLWTNFAKYDNPTPETTELLPVKWSPITSDLLNYLHIDLKMRMDTNFEHRRVAFWDLFFKAYGKYERGYNNSTKLSKNGVDAILARVIDDYPEF